MSDEIPMEEWKKCKFWQTHVPETGEVILQLQKGNNITGILKVDNFLFMATQIIT